MSTNVVVVGSCNLDLVAVAPALPAPGMTVLAGDVLTRPGGKGANQAVAAHKLGAATTFVAAVGTDQFGAQLRAALAGAGLDTDAVATVDGASGVALITVDADSENMITVAPGANYRLRAEHVRRAVERAPADAVLLMQLETPIATSLVAAESARRRGLRVVLNAAPAPGPHDPDLPALLQFTDVLIVNQTEALTLSGAPRPTDMHGWGDVAGGLRALGPDVVVLTLGAAGATLAAGQTVETFASRPVDVVDTTGAGDAFCGAFAATLASGRSPAEATRVGCLAGALATTALGAQAALPTAADIDRLAVETVGG